MTIKTPIYLDYQATTPLDKRVLDAMMPELTTNFGNPHSSNHIFGWNAAEVVEKARKQVASVIGANSKEIVFTSGATESNNLAIKGIAGFYGDKKNHIITVSTEHKCVIESFRFLERNPGQAWCQGFVVFQFNGTYSKADLVELYQDGTKWKARA